MWFRLAARWGCTVAEAQRRCSAAEFAEWVAFYSLEPWGLVDRLVESFGRGGAAEPETLEDLIAPFESHLRASGTEVIDGDHS